LGSAARQRHWPVISVEYPAECIFMLHSKCQNALDRWKALFCTGSFRWQFVCSLSLLIVVLIICARVLGWVEVRVGVLLDDPVLRMIKARDFTWLTFGLIGVGVALALIHLAPRPRRLLVAIQAYTMIVVLRMFMMWLVPLDPPEGLIVLHDPIMQFLGNGQAPTKDLFFSGHTATMFLFSLAATHRMMKGLFLAFTVLIAALMLWQHAHYTIDVVVAPFVTYICVRFIERFHATR
jgi:hypothetical protein